MKKSYLLVLTLLFTGISFNVFAQEWKWRDTEIRNLNERKLISTFYKSETFIYSVDFRKSIFNTEAFFNDSKFDSEVSFRRSKFKTNAEFINTEFYSMTDFRSAEFHSVAIFQKVNFFSVINFTGAEFKSKLIFKEAKFDSLADFSDVIFDKSVVFREAEFKGETDFTKTVLPGSFDFSRVKIIANEIDFTRSLSNPKYKICNINLIDAPVDKFRFRYKRFKLSFPDEDKAGYEIKAGIYEGLLRRQQEEGFTQSYEILDKEYREFQYTDPGAEQGSWGIILNWVDKNWWGYGYDKERIIRNVFLIFLLLCFINSFFLSYLITNVYANENIERLLKNHKNKNRLSRWFASLRYSMFYTAVIFFSFKFDMEKLNYSGNLDGWKVLNLSYFMVIYLGGLVCLAYLANYIITI